MNRWRIIGIVMLSIVAAGGAFAATRAMKEAPAAVVADDAAAEVLMNWLKVDASQRKELGSRDPAFPADLKKLREQLRNRRVDLAATLEDAKATDKQIRQNADAVMQASNQLEQRVLNYLLAVRTHLTPQQQQQLFRLAAEGLRQGPGWCWGAGEGQRGGGPGSGGGPGGGGGGGGGFGFRNRWAQ